MNQTPTPDQTQELNRIIYWSAGILALIAVLGYFAWSYAGVAVYFDRISNSFANCF